MSIRLAPYATKQLTSCFYFPEPGVFRHAPVSVTKRGRLGIKQRFRDATCWHQLVTTCNTVARLPCHSRCCLHAHRRQVTPAGIHPASNAACMCQATSAHLDVMSDCAPAPATVAANTRCCEECLRHLCVYMWATKCCVTNCPLGTRPDSRVRLGW
jgi:hypothetical protein